MKEKSFRHKVQSRQDTKPKYIHKLIKKAEERKREHDIIYERKLTKERSKEDHLYAEKDKFVTSAYRRKLEEQKKWEAEQHLRDLRDEKDDVTKKTDLSDFYFNLGKNVAFGGEESKSRNTNKQAEPTRLEKQEEQEPTDVPEKDRSSTYSNSNLQDIQAAESFRMKEVHQVVESSRMKEEHQVAEYSGMIEGRKAEPSAPLTSLDSLEDNLVQEKSSDGQPQADQPKRDHHKRSQDALAAAKERFLARKTAKEQ